MLYDIHSHIMPAIDDGAQTVEESLELLKLMKVQGIEGVIATPHFYPADDNLEEFVEARNKSFEILLKLSRKYSLPKILKGCELLYFGGISHSEAVSQFCLGNSKFLLLELTDDCVNEYLFDEIIAIRENLGLEPIIAHVERYCGAKKYKKFIKFLIANDIPIQINAASVLIPQFGRVIKKLLNSPLFCVVATDAHSAELRPPKLKEALDYIGQNFGEECRERLTDNAEYLYHTIAAV